MLREVLESEVDVPNDDDNDYLCATKTPKYAKKENPRRRCSWSRCTER